MNRAHSLSHLLLCLLVVLSGRAAAPTGAPKPSSAGDTVLLTAQGRVEQMRLGRDDWTAAQVDETFKAKDKLRTGFKSKATLRLSNQSVMQVAAATTLEIQPPAEEGKRTILDLKSGAAYFYNREGPGETEFRTPVASGAVRGTEFHLAVAADGSTVVTLLDGAVDLKNDKGEGVSLTSNEQGIVEPGKPPRKTAVINTINIIQWALYYPAILDLDELKLDEGVQQAVGDSLKAYRAGDLLQALASYPTNRAGVSAAENLYHASLLLAVGEVSQSEALLPGADGSGQLGRLANALRQLIAAVKIQSFESKGTPELATEWLAQSYYEQSRAGLEPAQSRLEKAREAARQATVKSPQFGFAWARLAELEFSFGRTDAAIAALEKALQFTPRNAQAVSLRGFLAAAQNRISDAITYFNQAIAIDGGLGNAWLGRGLCRIRQGLDFANLKGQSTEGRQDLQTAAALEPNRAVLRSYLGKAFSNEGDSKLARKELDLAKKLDPNDPTSWLYSALLFQQHNQINEAVRDLEKSKDMNENRRAFRSRLLLDQDQAVRGANLAAIYRDEGMFDVSVREASRAVNSDYANFSAHLFLAGSYDTLRDPRQINLRYDTPWLSELLLANLLAPVGGGSLSQNVSQQEYAKLFERDRIGFSSVTEYQSSGAWYEYGSQFGTIDNSSYALDFEYRTDPGQRPNNDMRSSTFYGKFKQQLTPKDSLFFQAIYYDFEGGDLAQYFDQTSASTTQRTKENQEPLVFAGYHHEWSPGNHTLFLAGRLNDTFKRTDSAFVGEVFRTTPGYQSDPYTFDLNYRSELEGFSTELQQILQRSSHTFVAGGRYQWADLNTPSLLNRPPDPNPLAIPRFSTPPADQLVDNNLSRVTLYAYDQWQALDSLRFTAGLSYDRLEYPVNIDDPPVIGAETEKDQVSPKAGFVWSITKKTFLRGAYTRSLGGVFFDSAVRLEPTQVAGFQQAYRSFIPESVVGLVAGSRFETYNLGLDHQFGTNTYVGIEGEYLDSTAERALGGLQYGLFSPAPAAPSTSPEQLKYREKSVVATLNHLLGREWSLGARYRLTHSDLEHAFLRVPGGAKDFTEEATLHQVNLYAIYNLPCGFFSQFNSLWNQQSNPNYATPRPGDDFWQFNIFVGYRFPRRLAEVRLGVLNLTDRDYQLNPLTLYNELPRERTFTASLKFNF